MSVTIPLNILLPKTGKCIRLTKSHGKHKLTLYISAIGTQALLEAVVNYDQARADESRGK